MLKFFFLIATLLSSCQGAFADSFSQPSGWVPRNGGAHTNGSFSTYSVGNVRVDFGASGSGTATTGAILASSNLLTVASSVGWKSGMGITVEGASGSFSNIGDGTELKTTVSSISGNIFTLAAPNTNGNLTGVAVKHDDTIALNNCINSALAACYIPSGTYNFTARILQTHSVNVFGDGAQAIGYFNNGGGSNPTWLVQSNGTILQNRTNGSVGLFELNISSIFWHDLSVIQDSTVSTSGGNGSNWAFVIRGQGSPGNEDIGNIMLYHIVIYGTDGGWLAQFGSSDSDGLIVSDSFAVTRGANGLSNIAVNSDGGGDFIWSHILGFALIQNQGLGINLINADVNYFDEDKMDQFAQDLIVSGGTVGNVWFIGDSLEGNSSPSTAEIGTPGGTDNISALHFIGGEINDGSTGAGLSLDIEGISNQISVVGTAIGGKTTGIKVNTSGNGISLDSVSWENTFTQDVLIGSSVTSNQLTITGSIPYSLISNTSAIPFTLVGNDTIQATNYRGVFSSINYYGSSTSASTAQQSSAVKIAYGQSGEPVTITNLPFTSSTSYSVFCQRVNPGNISQTINVTAKSASSFTCDDTLANGDNYNWYAIGT